MINDVLCPEIPANWESILLIADTHSGSAYGLNPWPDNPVQEKLWSFHKECRAWFGNRPDRMIFLGDAQEGIWKFLDFEDPKVNSQIEKYCEAMILWAPRKEYNLITGTDVHSTVNYQNLEYHIADRIFKKHLQYYGEQVEIKVYHKLQCRINGWFRIYARHYINPSRIPQYRATPALREQILHVLDQTILANFQDKKAEWAHLTVFGHAHYCLQTTHIFGTVLVLPGWKAGGKHGDQKFSGNTQLGIYKLVVSPKEEQLWGLYPKVHPATLQSEWEDK